jgi:hypothetical protein
MTPTPEQLTIVRAGQETEDNLLVSALAGAAKTSTLELIAKALDTEMLLLCFNKRNAIEAQERMPEHVKCMTLNGLGHRTWMDSTGRRLIVDKDKTYNLVSEYIKTLSQADQSFIYEKFGEILKIIAFGKACGYVPTGHHPRAKPLMDDASFFGHVEHQALALGGGPDPGRYPLGAEAGPDRHHRLRRPDLHAHDLPRSFPALQAHASWTRRKTCAP